MASRNALAHRSTNIPVAAVAQAPAQARKRAIDSVAADEGNARHAAGTRRALTAANLENLAQTGNDGNKATKRVKLARDPVESWQIDRVGATNHQQYQQPTPVVTAAAAAANATAAELQDVQQRSRQQHHAALTAWIETYKKKLPTFVFYFDTMPGDEVRKATRRIQAFGGVTHVITVRDVPKAPAGSGLFAAPNGNLYDRLHSSTLDGSLTRNRLNQHDASRSSDVIVKAQVMRQRVWPLRKLKDVMKQIYGDVQSTQVEAQTLSERLWQDRHLGYAETVPFTGPYVLVRDMSEQYKPIMQKQWKTSSDHRNGDWPQWRITRPGRCPFVRDSQAEHLPAQEVTEVKPEREGQYPKAAHLNASGMHQMTSAIQSTIHSASNNKENGNSALLASMHKKAISAKKSGQSLARPPLQTVRTTNAPTAASAVTFGRGHGQTGFAAPQQSQQSQQQQQQKQLDPTDSKKIKVVETRDGYCENCRVKFADFQQHLRTSQHQQYAANPDNFRELDQLLQSLQRIPREELFV